MASFGSNLPSPKIRQRALQNSLARYAVFGAVLCLEEVVRQYGQQIDTKYGQQQLKRRQLDEFYRT